MKPSWITGAAIISFWAVMTGLLIQARWRDGGAPFSDLPPGLVLERVLKNEMSSQMGIYEGQRRIGSVTITPTLQPVNTISFDGTLTISARGEPAKSLNFSLDLTMRPGATELNAISLRLRRREPALNALIQASLERQTLRYEISSDGMQLAAQEIPLNSTAMMASIPGIAGLPLPTIDPGSVMQSLQIHANRASATIRDERLDVFRLRFEAGEWQATATLGQLGEVFMVRTRTAYSLLAEGLDPAKQLK